MCEEAGANEADSLTAHPIICLHWFWFTNSAIPINSERASKREGSRVCEREEEIERERASDHFYILTHKWHRRCFFSFLRRNVSRWWGERRLHNRARLGSILFVCAIFIVHFFHVSLGYARMLFLGHVICFACSILCVCLYVKCPISAPSFYFVLALHEFFFRSSSLFLFRLKFFFFFNVR